jgi:hypothetical protein
MNTRLFRLEFLLLRSDPAAWTVLALMLFASTVAIVNGLSIVPGQLAAATQAKVEALKKQDETLKVVKAAGERGPTTAWAAPLAVAVRGDIYNFRAVLPPAPLAAAGFGQTDVHPQSFDRVNNGDDRPSLVLPEGDILSNVVTERKTESPLRLWLGRWDLTFVVVNLYPLFVLALCYDFITADRTSGTLALSLAQSVALPRLAAVRLCVRSAALILVGVVIPGSTMAVGHAWVGLPAAGTRLALWAVAAGVYIALWAAACLVVNAGSRSVARNAVILVSLWAGAIVVAPAAIGLLARTFTPVDSNMRLVDTERAVRDRSNEITYDAYKALIDLFDRTFPADPSAGKEAKAVRDRLRFTAPLPRPEGNRVLDAFYAARPEFGKDLVHYQIWYAAQLGRDFYIREHLAPALAQLERQRARQSMAVRALAYASPALLARGLLEGIAGTDDRRHEQFLRQYSSFVNEREAWFCARIASRTDIAASDLRRLAAFRFVEAPPMEVIHRAAVPILWLVAVVMVLLRAGIRRCRQGGPLS